MTPETHVNKLLVKIEVYDDMVSLDDGDEPIVEFIINQYNPEGRRRLAKCAWWAMHNNHPILTYPVKDAPEG